VDGIAHLKQTLVEGHSLQKQFMPDCGPPLIQVRRMDYQTQSQTLSPGKQGEADPYFYGRIFFSTRHSVSRMGIWLSKASRRVPASELRFALKLCLGISSWYSVSRRGRNSPNSCRVVCDGNSTSQTHDPRWRARLV